jgi:hypothetical protein
MAVPAFQIGYRFSFDDLFADYRFTAITITIENRPGKTGALFFSSWYPDTGMQQLVYSILHFQIVSHFFLIEYQLKKNVPFFFTFLTGT